MSVIPNPDKKVAQLIDANLDRAREGLRVIEEWCRYVIQNKELITKIKDYRHQLGSNHKEIYKSARSAYSDQGSGLTHPSQEERTNELQIVMANFARVQEALRVLEEFSRNSDQNLHKISSTMRYEIYQLEVEVLEKTRANELQEKLNSCNLCVITQPHKDLEKIIKLVLKEGVKMIQYRCKTGTDIQNYLDAKRLSVICKQNKALFIINDRIDIALAVDADGVHLGQEDIQVDIARKVLGYKKIIGVSTHSLQEAKKAEAQGSDYIGIGPIFASSSKHSIIPLGIEGLREIKESIAIPIFAIGGINSSNISLVIDNGITHIALIDAIINAKEPDLASREILRYLS